jgi:anaerobic ribonucleoside-triphosphate reductase
MQVIKRNGEIQEFDFEKIKTAVTKAFKATGRSGVSSIFFEDLEH